MPKSEAQIQAECFKFLCSKKVFAHSVPNESAGRSKVMQGQLVTMGLRSGVGDMVVWWPDGIGYVEFKTQTGKQSQNQITFERLCAENGVDYAVVRSLDDMVRLYEKHRRLAGEAD